MVLDSSVLLQILSISGQPLAFKGEDFNLTDLEVVKLG